VASSRLLIELRSAGQRTGSSFPDAADALLPRTSAVYPGGGKARGGGYAAELAGNSLFEEDGSGKPTLAALATCASVLGSARNAGRVETAALQAYLFMGDFMGDDEGIIAAWAPGAVTQPKEFEVNLPPRAIAATDFMGNRAGFRSRNGKTVLIVGSEPVYVRVRDVTPEALLAAVKGAKLETPPPKAPKAKPKEGPTEPQATLGQ
jgi:hypothetical protein